jgi:UDP-N-acetylglucosamine 2-epimerase (non-hydrolysing)
MWGFLWSSNSARPASTLPGGYGIVTLHRPSNVDLPKTLVPLCDSLINISRKLPLVFPIHPRTKKNMAMHGLLDSLINIEQIQLIEPLPYISFMNLVLFCRLAITDSGGIQEETTYLGIPCITLRPNTERPVTVTEGTNQLCKTHQLEDKVGELLASNVKRNSVLELWDADTASRVVASIRRHLNAAIG